MDLEELERVAKAMSQWDTDEERRTVIREFNLTVAPVASTILKLLAVVKAAKEYREHIDEFRSLMTRGLKSEEDHLKFREMRSSRETEAALWNALDELEGK